jgi:hypothetical protein
VRLLVAELVLMIMGFLVDPAGAYSAAFSPREDFLRQQKNTNRERAPINSRVPTIMGAKAQRGNPLLLAAVAGCR